jgi:hypothetical protein
MTTMMIAMTVTVIQPKMAIICSNVHVAFRIYIAVICSGREAPKRTQHAVC